MDLFPVCFWCIICHFIKHCLFGITISKQNGADWISMLCAEPLAEILRSANAREKSCALRGLHLQSHEEQVWLRIFDACLTKQERDSAHFIWNEPWKEHVDPSIWCYKYIHQHMLSVLLNALKQGMKVDNLAMLFVPCTCFSEGCLLSASEHHVSVQLSWCNRCWSTIFQKCLIHFSF